MKPRRPLPAPVRSATPEAPAAVVVGADPAADVLADLAANAGLAPAAAVEVAPAPVVEAAPKPAPKPLPKAPPKPAPKAPPVVAPVVETAPAPAPKQVIPKAPPSAALKAVAVLPEGCVAVPREELEALLNLLGEAKVQNKGQKEWLAFLAEGFTETVKWASRFSFEGQDKVDLDDLIDEGQASHKEIEGFSRNTNKLLNRAAKSIKAWLG